MEMRKLMAFGQSSYIVSLPKGWVEKNRMKKGDIIMVDERPNELVLSPQGKEERRKWKVMNIECKGKTAELVKTEIIAAYINNYDIMNVRFDAAYAVKSAKKAMRELAGMEVVEETSTRLVAKEMLDVKEVSLSNLIRRMDTIIRAMLDALDGLKHGAQERLYEMDAEVNRLTLLTFRTVRAAMENPRLMRLFEVTAWDCAAIKTLAERMERFADQIKRLGRSIEEGLLEDKKQHQDCLRMYGKVKQRYLKLMTEYYEKKNALAFHLEGEQRLMLKECDLLAENYDSVGFAWVMERVKHMITDLNGISRAMLKG